MLAAERRERILTAAHRDGAVRVAALAAELCASGVTIRRDLEALTAQGLLEKVRGGAMLRTSSTGAPAAAGAPHLTSHPQSRPQAVLGVLIPSAYYFRHIVDGARRVAAEQGGAVRLVTSGYDTQAEQRLVRELVESGATGLLLSPSFVDGGSASLPYLREPSVPTVLIERELPPTELATVSTVRSAHERGVAAALAHLHELGHRRVALISRVFSQTGSFVRRGYRQAAASLGLDQGVPEITGTDAGAVRPGLMPEGPAAVFRQLVDAEVTAVLCHGDEDALALSQYARANNRPVPGRLSIVSYNDEVAALGDPPLTAVAPPKERIGAVGAQLLFNLLESEADQTPVHVQIDPQLIIRSSTAPPALTD